MEIHNCHCSGYATRNDLVCGDGRTIRKDAFKDCDGKTVPLIYNHDHNNPDAVLGHAILENRDDGVYAYLTFNETEQGQKIKECVEHGDVRSLSIYANKLKQIGNDVVHGIIRELSVVLAGANPGAYIDWVMAHDDESGEGLIANYDETGVLTIYHSSDSSETKKEESAAADAAEKTESEEGSKDETVHDVFNQAINKLTEKEQNAVYAVVALSMDDEDVDDKTETSDDDSDTKTDNKNVEHSEGGTETMKTNVFDQTEVKNDAVLSHADQEAILEMAKKPGVGSFRQALAKFAEENKLAHGLDLGDTETLEELLPDHKLLNPGAPEVLRADQGWVMGVINKIRKSPYSRIRTRYADARIAELKAKGYNNRKQEKALADKINLIGRKTEPTTVYIKEELHRDDINDITDFDVVAHTQSEMKVNMYETLALASLVGDGRDATDPDKINETNIRPVWKDEEAYTIHADVDIEAAKTELQGSNTSANFGENYIYAEAIITASLYAREKYKGSGSLDFYCAPHLVNVMLLARDLNGRRIYDSKADLARALNVNSIIEVEQFAGLTREDAEGNTKKLLGLFVNLADYQFGSTKGGEITKFSDFDIDFNKYKYLMETRLSGALVKLESAIALEEPVAPAAAG